MLRDAVSAGARVGIIAGTCSTAEEGIVNGVLKALGEDLSQELQVFTYASDRVTGAASSSEGPTPRSFEQSMAAAQAQVLPPPMHALAG